MRDIQENVLSSKYSSTEIARLSVPRRRAELFLERLANLDIGNAGEAAVSSDDEARFDRRVKVFIETFSDLLPTCGAVLNPETSGSQNALGNPDLADPNRFLAHDAWPLIRSIWREPAPLLREAGLMILAGKYMNVCGVHGLVRETRARYGLGSRDELSPGFDGFLMVLLHAVKHVHLLRYCANPECKEPYFVARRGSQIYCSSPCAEPAQREAKSKWWREHGDARRKKSRKGKGKHAKAT